MQPTTGSRFRRFGLLIAILALLAAACGAEGKVDADPPAATETRTDPIFLQRVDGDEIDAFMESVALAQFATFPAIVQKAIDALLADFAANAETGLRSAPGDAPGLYGGTGDDSVCNLALLVDHLVQAEDHTKAKAFAAALDIPLDDLIEYVSDLTPVVLTTDTLVTNHGYRNGVATPFPAVLQAGTAVAVDRQGVPRVKCGCGNPLAPAPGGVKIDADTPTEGDTWSNWDPAAVSVIEDADEPLDEFTLLDVETGDTYTVPAGSGFDDCYIDEDGHGPDCDPEEEPDPVDDCYIDEDGHGPDCDPVEEPAPVDDCYIDADGHGPDCDPVTDQDCPIDPWGDPECDESKWGWGGPDDLVFLKGWGANGNGHGIGTVIAAKCPPNGTLGEIAGNNPYEIGSSICTAGVHAGRITQGEGGVVSAEIVDERVSDGSPANGVDSGPTGNPRGAFRIH